MLLRRQFLGASFAAACSTALSGCGLIMYPERRGQSHNGRIDWKVAALDGLGLCCFFVPGVIAFAVDFATGAIYLPSEQYGADNSSEPPELVTVHAPNESLDQEDIERIVSDHIEEPFQLVEGTYEVRELTRIEQFQDDLREFFGAEKA